MPVRAMIARHRSGRDRWLRSVELLAMQRLVLMLVMIVAVVAVVGVVVDVQWEFESIHQWLLDRVSHAWRDVVDVPTRSDTWLLAGSSTVPRDWHTLCLLLRARGSMPDAHGTR